MNKIIQAVSEFLRSKNITSHTVVVLIIGAAGLISSDEQVRSFLVGALASHPKIASGIIGLAGIILKYSRDSSTRGAALNILSDAQQPIAQGVVTVSTPAVPATATFVTPPPITPSEPAAPAK